MPKLLIPLATCLLWSGSAQAITVFTDNFDGENGGLSAPAYNAFTHWEVDDLSLNFTPPPPGAPPSVDLVRSGDFGLTCDGGRKAPLGL